MWYPGRFIESLLGQRKPEKKDEEKSVARPILEVLEEWEPVFPRIKLVKKLKVAPPEEKVEEVVRPPVYASASGLLTPF